MTHHVSSDADPTVGFNVNIIHCWTRDSLPDVIMSASSGPKDYLRNHVHAIFDRFPGVTRILMVRGEYAEIGRDKHNSPAFLLCENALGELFDIAGELVQLRRAGAL